MNNPITLIGKALVYLTLLMGMAMGVFAVGIATNRLNWAGAPAGGPDGEGLHARKQAEIKELQQVFMGRFSYLKREQGMLVALETKRSQDQRWYTNQVTALEAGKDAQGRAVNPAVNMFTYNEATGRLDVDNKGLPALKPHRDDRMKPRAELRASLDAIETDIVTEIKAVHKLIEEEKEYTNQLQGEPGKRKGLLSLLDETLLAQKNSAAELRHAQTEATNGKVAANSLIQRNQALTRRIDELRRAAVAAANLP